MAKIQTLTENWVLNSSTTPLWNGWFGTTAITGNQVVYTVSSGALNYEGFDSSKTDYTLVDSYLFHQLIDGGNQSLVTLEVYLAQLLKDANNKLTWYLNQNLLKCCKVVAGGALTQIGSSINYVPATHNGYYFRIRELDNVIYWDYSPDGVDWINQTSELVSNLFDVSSMKFEMSAEQWGGEVSGTTCKTGNVNFVSTNRPSNQLRHITVGSGMSCSEGAN